VATTNSKVHRQRTIASLLSTFKESSLSIDKVMEIFSKIFSVEDIFHVSLSGPFASLEGSSAAGRTVHETFDPLLVAAGLKSKLTFGIDGQIVYRNRNDGTIASIQSKFPMTNGHYEWKVRLDEDGSVALGVAEAGLAPTDFLGTMKGWSYVTKTGLCWMNGKNGSLNANGYVFASSSIALSFSPHVFELFQSLGCFEGWRGTVAEIGQVSRCSVDLQSDCQ
jgi:hypothetical protein